MGGDVSKLSVALEIKLQKVKQSFWLVGMCLGRNLGGRRFKKLGNGARAQSPCHTLGGRGPWRPPPAVCGCGPGGPILRREARGCPGADGFAARGWTRGRA